MEQTNQRHEIVNAMHTLQDKGLDIDYIVSHESYLIFIDGNIVCDITRSQTLALLTALAKWSEK